MKREYDFSKGERGKFYRQDATFNVPVYLDKDVLTYLSEKAASKGVEVNQLINDILRKDIDLFQALE
jgi:predicted HicB family RNase H-like nuclease